MKSTKIEAAKRLEAAGGISPFGNVKDKPVSELKVEPAEPVDPNLVKKLTALATKIVAILKESDEEIKPKVVKTDLGVDIILGTNELALDLGALTKITAAVKKYNPTDSAILYVEVLRGKLKISVTNGTTIGL